MSDVPYIPRATAEALATSYPEGTRHEAKIKIAIPLIANGMSPAAVFAELRSKFPAATDKEISGVIEWVTKQPFTPSTPQNGNGYRGNGRGDWKPPPTSSGPKRSPGEQIEWWLNGLRMSVEQIEQASPIQLPPEPEEALSLAFATLYTDDEHMNIVCDYSIDEKKGKANPKGAGKIDTKQGWIDYFQLEGVPSSKAGAWFRINPCAAKGTGFEGAVCDKDITSFRYMLVEFDKTPIDAQLAFYYKFKLPVAAILLSGGKSAHAWIKIGAKDEAEFDERAAKIHELLKPFGADGANKNPSRLSRLPNATRVIQSVGDGLQKLLYLNPMVENLTDEGLKRFEEALAFPVVQEKPLQQIAQDAMARYEWMRANQGKLGVPIGIPQMDRITGGLKNGQTTVIAGVTGGCKTTLALHAICTALENKYGVLLFSLEMDKEEIFDLMVSRYSFVSRNKFNNGKFSDFDFERIGKVLPNMNSLPLFIEDQAMTNAQQIRARTLQLVAEKRIGLAVVDYIQFVNPEWSKETREQQVAQISHTLRALAREAKIPMIILSQLNDEGLLRESRVIAHNANIVLMVEVAQSENPKENDELKITVKKGRGIPQGNLYMDFDRLHARLIPMTTTSGNDYGKDDEEESAAAKTEITIPPEEQQQPPLPGQ